MNSAEVSKGISQVLKNQGIAADVDIFDGKDAGLDGKLLAIGATNAIDVDKIQAICTTINLTLVRWVKDEHGDLMIYRIA